MVRKQDRVYELIDGERRLRALKELGWKTAPVRVVKLNDKIVRRSVYKVNKVRENYTVEEEARYFKKLTDEGMTPWEISKELGVISIGSWLTSIYSSFPRAPKKHCGPGRSAFRILLL